MHGKKFRKSSTFSIFFTQEDRSDKNVTSISVSHTNEVFINKQLSDDSVSKPTDVNIYKSPIQDVKTKEEEEEKEDEDSTKWQEQYSRYAKNPIINEDVLKYGFEKVKNETNFRCWDLTEWLIENNPVLRDESKKDKQQRPSTRIKNRLKPVKHMLDNLEELGIITSRNVRAKKGKYDTKEYKFTYAGYLIILLFEKYNGNTEAINKKIYQLLQDSYNKLRT